MPAERRVDKLRRLTGLTRRELECYDEAALRRWLEAELSEETIWRIRRVRRLRQIGLDYDAIEIIVRLLDRMEQLESSATAGSVRVRVIED
jgi:hypothetical protein